MALEPFKNLSDAIKCINFAAIKHKDQRRKNIGATPYINHPIGVAHILIDEGNVNDPNVILAAILHDTVEDTDTTIEEIEENFGKKIASIVKECTYEKSIPRDERKHLQIVNAAETSKEAKLVKLADHLYNLRDLDNETPVGWSQERVSEYFEWSHKVIENLKGINPLLEKKLEELFKSHNLKVN